MSHQSPCRACNGSGVNESRHAKRYTAREMREVVDAYTAGASSVRLQRRFGTDRKTVMKWVRILGGEVRSKGDKP